MGIHPNGGGQSSPKIGMSYVEPEWIKPVESPVHHSGPRHVPKSRKSWIGLKHSVIKVVEHSLQVTMQEIKKTWELKILKLKGGHSANATLIFNSWLKDIDMCVWDHNWTEYEAVQLVKDYTREHAHGALKFYLNMNNEWSYSKLTEHLRTSFQSGETPWWFLWKVPQAKINQGSIHGWISSSG